METSKVGAMAQQEGVEGSGSSVRADAFRDLADKHLDASYGLAYLILGQRAEAEDATHDAFVTAWRKWSTLRDHDLFQHWFDRILVNTCRNRLRHAPAGGLRTSRPSCNSKLRTPTAQPTTERCCGRRWRGWRPISGSWSRCASIEI